MAADGVRSATAFVTSAYSSYSSCRQYLDDIARARKQVGETAPRIERLRPYFNHPGFIEPLADATAAAIESLPAAVRRDADLIFTAHSIPAAMAAASGPRGGAYPAQLAEASRLIAERVRLDPGGWPIRAGAGRRRSRGSARMSVTAWRARPAGSRAVVLIPVGFVSDHLEVRYDLDVEGAQAAERLGPGIGQGGDTGHGSPFRIHGH